MLVSGNKYEGNIVVQNEIFYRDGFGIYAIEVDGFLITMKGRFPKLKEGSTYFVEGMISEYHFQKQLEVQSIRVGTPTGRDAVISYLQTLPGLKKRADVLYNYYGENTIAVLTDEPERVEFQIKGVSLKTALKWSNALKKNKEEEDIYLFLYNFGLTQKQVETIVEKYGTDTYKVLKENPYQMIKDLDGYGFKRVDEIVLKSGFGFYNIKRIEAGIIYALDMASRKGHTYQPVSELVSLTMNLLSLIGHRELVDVAIQELGKKGEIVIRNEGIYNTKFDKFERMISYYIKRLSVNTPWKRNENERILQDILDKEGYILEEQQKLAALTFSAQKGGVYALIGSAGTGKTFVLKIVLEVLRKNFEANGQKMLLKIVAPTGKAAKVVQKATELPASTVHRALGYRGNGDFEMDETNPLKANVIVVEESSMLDTEMAFYLLRAIQEGSKVIFMGDIKQLPSVGAGNVLKDILSSSYCQSVMLNVIKRQSEDNLILENANAIIDKQMIESKSKDSFVIFTKDDREVLRKTILSYKRLLELQYDIDDIQILTAMKAGLCGTHNLNREIQQLVNPNGIASSFRNKNIPDIEKPLYFKKNDKVIHLVNQKDKEIYKDIQCTIKSSECGVYNGDTGRIVDVCMTTSYENDKPVKKETLIVKYDDGYVMYKEEEDINALDHAYALSIHKSQGSQWFAVIIPLAANQKNMLDNTLAYTGHTRAREFQVTIGQYWVIQKAIVTENMTKRFTGLSARLNTTTH